MVGMRIGAYQLMEELGGGAMGTVFKAVHTGLNKEMAVKMLDPEQAGNDVLRKRFLNEAQVLSRLNSPHIVTVYDFVQHQDRAFIVMEHVDGGTLQKLLAHRDRLPPAEALNLIRQVLLGVRHAHEAQPPVIHRDLRPGNILISRQGQVKVSDFGTAQLIGKEHMTAGGMALGTAYYMAPECHQGEESDAPTIDIYSLGVTLYEMCCGRKPYTGEDEVALVRTVLKGKPVQPKAVVEALPDRLESAILKAMHRDPKQRFHTAAEFLAEVETAKKELAEQPATPTLTGVRVSVEPRPRSLAKVAATILALAGVGLLGYAGWRYREQLIPWLRRVPHPRWVISAAIVGVGLCMSGLLVLLGRRGVSDEICPECGSLAAPSWAACPFCKLQQTDDRPKASLQVVQGARVGARYPMGGGATTIGRSAENGIYMEDPGLSKMHARISWAGGKYVLQDLDSKNGCFVNRRRVTRATLRHKDLIQLGSTLFEVTLK